ncbi:MAG: hypothetical protein AB7I79_20605 [Rhizobiaceae bacterium]
MAIRRCITWISVLLGVSLAGSAAAWEKIEGGVSARPVETNSNVEALLVHCLEGPAIDLYARDGGPVLPADRPAPAEYFYLPGLVVADVDGRTFPLVAAGSDIAVILFSEGAAEQNYMAPVDRALLEAMATGTALTIRFDITTDAAPDGSPHETFIRFDLADATALINEAVAACG